MRNRFSVLSLPEGTASMPADVILDRGSHRVRHFRPGLGFLGAALMACCLISRPATAALRAPNPDDDFTVSEVMVPMRDGVKLHTVVLAPKGGSSAMPLLLLRTPYGAADRLKVKQVTQLQSMLGPEAAELQGYIYVFQDVRGRNGSEGEFVLARPVRGPFNTTSTDETTDAWDTVDWIVKNVERNNGRVGIYGTSYSGWTTLMALLDPHPALKAAVPVNPAVDFWMGDDWFHNGAFRPAYAFEYVHALESDPSAWTPFPFSQADTYAWWLKAGSAREVGARYFDEARHKYWTLLTQRPAYDAYWQDGALDGHLRKSKAPLVPTLHVHGLFDQEDIYGAPAAYAAMEPRDARNDRNFFVAGPWYHGQNWSAGERLGALRWNEDTAKHWRENTLAPFLAEHLKNEAPATLAPVEVFNTGTRRWNTFTAWPEAPGTSPRSLYLQPGQSVDWKAPTARRGAADSFVSDPAKPVPYQPRPVRRIYDDDAGYAAWQAWLVADQRFVDGRPDVLTYVSEPITEVLTLRGAVSVVLLAETTGSDADWVVKLIDVFPDHDAAEPEMGGYQFMISGDVLRGRYREGFDVARAIEPSQPLEYRFGLPQVNHTFKPGHRIMVQVQSSWFPLYDRNPQTFMPSIMEAKPGDYRAATHRVHVSAELASRLEVRADAAVRK
jgi:putative CocE/NonD family hydrolase